MLISILLSVLIVLGCVQIFLTLRQNKSEAGRDFGESLEKGFSKTESALRDEFSRSREESARTDRQMREELTTAFQKFSESVTRNMTDITALVKQELNVSRDESAKSLKSFEDKFGQNVKDFNELQRQKFSDLMLNQEKANQQVEQRLEKMRETIEGKLKSIQDDNNAKLEKMRETVDEKLHKTLEERLGKSFEQVSKRLEEVHKGLGEMQNLATGVGDLKKVLSNVKTRGVLGEIQLEKLLEQLLIPEQYEKNVNTRKGSNAVVEFAIKLPGREDHKQYVWLPIDAKFPIEVYNALLEAYEKSDLAAVDIANKQMISVIKNMAKDIRDKYIDPPGTTDFAIMFLPFEGLYAEVLRQKDLFETIQRDYKVVITGPTTLSAVLNALQMGFRTLAIQKRSSEVWQILSVIKKDFGEFGKILDHTQKKLQEASNVIEKANSKTRRITKVLNKVEDAPHQDTMTDAVENTKLLKLITDQEKNPVIEANEG